MTVYCAVDFHARQQTISYCDTADGEIHRHELHHQRDNVRQFYARFSGEVIVGLEASGYSAWFEELLEELQHTVWLGNPAEIRRRASRRQKNDRRDADLILDLMLKGDFPRLHRFSAGSRLVLRQLRYRHKLVKVRTIAKNSLHAISINAGLPLKRALLSRRRDRAAASFAVAAGTGAAAGRMAATDCADRSAHRHGRGRVGQSGGDG